jgi:hypothetical protein
MSENDSLDKTSELYKDLPFMEAFPFKEYEITLETEGIDSAELGIAPILLNTLGTFGTENHINFNYIENDELVLISFYLEDVVHVSNISQKIKKLNSVKDDLNEGLSSNSLQVKIDHIKKSKKFIKLLESDNLEYAPFTDVLQDMMSINDVTLTSQQVLGIQKLNLLKIQEEDLVTKQREVIVSFLNFQLHYARIILGIVIAAKIY